MVHEILRLPSAAYYFLSTSHIFFIRFFRFFSGRENAIIKIIVFTMLYETVTNTFNSLLSKNIYFFSRLFFLSFSSSIRVIFLLVMLDYFLFSAGFERGDYLFMVAICEFCVPQQSYKISNVIVHNVHKHIWVST